MSSPPPTDPVHRGEPQRGSYGAGLGFGTASFAVNALLGIAASILTARLYGITTVGDFALAGAPVGAVWLLSTVREQPALLRALAPLPARDPAITGLFASVFTFSVALTAVVSVIAGVVAAVLFNGPIHHPGLVLPAQAMLLGSLLFMNTCWNLDTVFNAFRAGRPLFWCRFHQALLYLLVAAGLSLVSTSVWGLILAWYGSWATSLLQRVLSVRRFMRFRVARHELAAGFSTLPEVLRFGLKLTPGFLAEGVSDESGAWILGALSSVDAVGAYSRAWMMARRGLELNYRVTEMLFPTLIERRLSGDRAGFDRALVDSLRYVALAMLLPAAVLAGAAAPIMSIYGQGFASATTAFAYLAFVPGVITLSAVQSHALFAEDRGLLTSLFGTARTVATLLSAVLLTRAYGVSGMGAGMLIGACAQLAPLSLRLPRLLDGPLHELWRPREVLSLLGAGAVGFATARAISDGLPHAGALVLAPASGLAAMAGVFLVAGGLQPRDRERAQRLTRSFSDRRNGAGGRLRRSSGTP
jgi:O-antigen/teichoic acid export membrane protein